MAWDGHMKADHNGAKNGGGYYGYRQEAKENAKVARRKQAKQEIRAQLDEVYLFERKLRITGR